MKTDENKSSKVFKGAGMLIGFGIGITAAAVIFLITESIALIAPMIGAFGIPVGISLERRFQGETDSFNDPIIKRVLIIVIAAGILLFSLTFLFTRII